MSEKHTASETPGHRPLASAEHHRAVAELRQVFADLHFRVRFAPSHARNDEGAGNAEQAKLTAIDKLREAEVAAVAVITGYAEKPRPSFATVRSVVEMNASAVVAANKIYPDGVDPAELPG